MILIVLVFLIEADGTEVIVEINNSITKTCEEKKLKIEFRDLELLIPLVLLNPLTVYLKSEDVKSFLEG